MAPDYAPPRASRMTRCGVLRALSLMMASTSALH
jgi:hypothetical protein